jgi:D-alanyl-lipoteichoic acid acyltransferase DltB (MBOAT superfamily)
MGVVLYAFQLYCDFMGYSYIALGSAKALGFELPANFRQPYFSKSVKEFWGRWHISLSEWLRDYIYFPLGGSRKGRARTMINIAIVFVVSGIWHGSGLTFLVWGTLHGLYRIVEELVGGTRDSKKAAVKDILASKSFAGVAVIRTFILVEFVWLFFRAESVESAFVIIRRIFTESEMVRTIREGLYTFGLAKKEVLVWLLGLLVVIVIDILHEKGIHVGEWLKKRNIILRWAFYLIFVCFMLGTMIYYYGYSASTFIYSGF